MERKRRLSSVTKWLAPVLPNHPFFIWCLGKTISFLQNTAISEDTIVSLTDINGPHLAQKSCKNVMFLKHIGDDVQNRSDHNGSTDNAKEISTLFRVPFRRNNISRQKQQYRSDLYDIRCIIAHSPFQC